LFRFSEFSEICHRILKISATIHQGKPRGIVAEISTRKNVKDLIFLEFLCLDAVQGASEACDQAVVKPTAREQTSEATKKCAKQENSNNKNEPLLGLVFSIVLESGV
jgi:hypothetical protein